MQFIELNSKHSQRQRWQRFWPRLLLVFIAITEILLASVIIGLELWSMIINVKYFFFFIGFITSLFIIITSISTFSLMCCCDKSFSCATYVLAVHILSIVALSVLLYYDSLFLRDTLVCLWPNDLCDEDLLHLNFFGIALGINTDINSIKFTLIKIQIVFSVVMILLCLIYIGIYIYMIIRVHRNNRITNPHTTIELGRVQSPPPPYWPPPPTAKSLPPSSQF